MEEPALLPTIAPSNQLSDIIFIIIAAINTTFTYNHTQACFSLAIPDVHLLFTFDLLL